MVGWSALLSSSLIRPDNRVMEASRRPLRFRRAETSIVDRRLSPESEVRGENGDHVEHVVKGKGEMRAFPEESQ